MSTEADLKELFEKWNDYNKQVQEFMAGLDLTSVKKIREQQKKIEDIIYELLRKNAPKDYLDLLPDECGELEVGYDTTNKVFYFVMIDPSTENEEEVKLIAFSIDTDNSVNRIQDFKIEE